MKEFYLIRLAYYVKRKEHKLRVLKRELDYSKVYKEIKNEKCDPVKIIKKFRENFPTIAEFVQNED